MSSISNNKEGIVHVQTRVNTLNMQVHDADFSIGLEPNMASRI